MDKDISSNGMVHHGGGNYFHKILYHKNSLFQLNSISYLNKLDHSIPGPQGFGQWTLRLRFRYIGITRAL